MRVVYSRRYHLDLGAHVFPAAKYRAIANQLVAQGLVAADGFVEPEAASWLDLGLVHTASYLDTLERGALTPADIARLEMPATPAIIEGLRFMSGGTIRAARLALDGSDPVAVHLGGGFHHAFAGHGEGFCVFNDIAVAIRVAFRDRWAASAAVIDLDVHQGNGTAAIFAGDRRVFTLSVHEQANYPDVKPPSALDIGLDRGTGDGDYLAALEPALARTFEHLPDLAIYVAGADPYLDDQLGGLALTFDGLRRRDRMVLQTARAAGVPIVIVLAGGYARRFEDTVAIHVATVEEAAAV
jgi:acetoin utilization deacetylase AcuC-like enzyme